MAKRRGQSSAAILVLLVSLTAPWKCPAQAAKYKILDDGLGLELIWRERRHNVWPQELLIETSQGPDRPVSGPWNFNWVARRSPYFLVSGDLPRFGLARTFKKDFSSPPRPAALLNPAIAKLGDLRVRYKVLDHWYWLDEQGISKTRFYPWGTVHEIAPKLGIPLTFKVESFLVRNRGMGVDIQVAANAKRPVAVEIELLYGGVAWKEPAVNVPYFEAEEADREGDRVRWKGRQALLSDPSIPVELSVTASTPGLTNALSEPAGAPVVFRYTLQAGGSAQAIRLLAQERVADGTQATVEQFAEHLRESKAYYQRLLSPFDIQTPDEELNAALRAGIVNLDYAYDEPAWFEGIHHWNSYIVNNYQISAAIALGQFDKAREALLFFGDRPGGPGQTINTDGSVFDMIPHLTFEGGLHYYILQLYRYWIATGDSATLDRAWQPTRNNLERMLELRDPEGNGLMNWHRGANMFLYQGDHISLPGDAWSPTVMTAFVLQKMAEMAIARGENEVADEWTHLAKYTQAEALQRFWRPHQGRFAAAIDAQGLELQANYYTDFIFPQLYSTLPTEYSWISLKTLDRTLWVGNDLMRVGNFMPQLFGNNNIMPVQMAEASEAYFRLGRSAEGSRLLHGVARGVVTYTDSPGSFPERMSDSGQGQPDFLFSNPAGAYVHAVVSGLFGIERQADDHPLQWHPSIPEDWEHAGLKVNGISVAIDGRHGDRKYSLALDRAQAATVLAPLRGYRQVSVLDANGNPLPFHAVPHPGGGFLQIEFAPGTRHEFRVVASEPPGKFGEPGTIEKGRPVSWALPEAGMSVHDPQRVFEEFRIEGIRLRGKVNDENCGQKTVFFWNQEGDTVLPADLTLPCDAEPLAGPVVLAGERLPLNLDTAYNSATIEARNFWQHAAVKVDLSEHVAQQQDHPILRVGAYDFQVRPSGRNLILIEVGDLDPSTRKLHLSTRPSQVVLDIAKQLQGVEFLMVADPDVRLTQVAIGSMEFTYSDGFRSKIPLVAGHNIDCMSKPYATGVSTYRVRRLQHVFAFSVPVDSTRVLDSALIKLTAADVSLGILAVNLVSAR